MSNSTTNPFYLGTFQGHDLYSVTAEDRINRVKTFTLAECQAALHLPDLQRTVLLAVTRRMKALKKGGAQ